MTTRPAAAPKGPASYFPSIEKHYGQPVDHWIGLVRRRHAAGATRHGELVSWLKREHAMGHGHANAVVAHTLGLIKAEV